MLYVYHGTDQHEVVRKGQRLIAGLQERRPGAQVFVFEPESFELSALDELIEAQGLFVERHIVALRKLTEVAEVREALFERLERLLASPNIFVVTEGKLDTRHVDTFATYATKIEVCTAAARREATYNVFALGDALGMRDKKKLWIGYHDARSHGETAESIQGTLAWAARMLVAAGNAQTPEEAGMKPFLFSKYARFAQNYSARERTLLSRSLVALYHEARRGKDTLEGALERFILTC